MNKPVDEKEIAYAKNQAVQTCRLGIGIEYNPYGKGSPYRDVWDKAYAEESTKQTSFD